MNPAGLKTLEAIAKIKDKENKILSASFINLEWSLQRKLTCPTEADSYELIDLVGGFVAKSTALVEEL